MAGTVVADTLQAASTSTLVLKNGVADTPPTIQDSAGTEIGTFCRAWVNFNGTGTVAIRSSFNVSSITDNGTGDYTVNLTNAMPDANYSLVGLCRINGNNLNNISFSSATNPTTTAARVITNQGTLFDADYVNVSIFR
jgi:hypothetical protein